MGARIQRTVEPIQLDVDWLIGKRTDPRLRLPTRKRWLTSFTAISLGLLVVSSLLIAWPTLSSRWLAHEFRRALAASDGVDESLQLLVSLNELGELSHREIVAMLGSKEAHLRNTSYRLLREKISEGVGSYEGLRGCYLLLTELVKAQYSENESIHLRSLLCAEALDEMDRLSPNASVDQVKELCRSVLASQPLLGKASGFTTADAVQSAEVIADIPKALPHAGRDSAVSSQSIGVAKVASSLPSHLDVPLPAIPEPLATGVFTSAADSAAPNDSPSKEQSNPLRATTIAFEQSLESSNGAIMAVSHRADQMDLSGLESLSLENLFTLLSSTQERRVRMVCDELFRRGVPTEIVEIAIDMARGDSQIQLEAMEQAVRGGAINPVPLLAWMAQSQDRKIRHRAIALLGAMQDRDAHLKLRSLFQREPDKQLQQMIQQALVAGTGSNRGNLP